jgi:hypothetical protein
MQLLHGVECNSVIIHKVLVFDNGKGNGFAIRDAGYTFADSYRSVKRNERYSSDVNENCFVLSKHIVTKCFMDLNKQSGYWRRFFYC